MLHMSVCSGWDGVGGRENGQELKQSCFQYCNKIICFYRSYFTYYTVHTRIYVYLYVFSSDFYP